jgi:hypothetical protein
MSFANLPFEFKITTWNVENYFHPRYAGNPPKGIAKASPEKSGHMVQIIYGLSSDVFFLSEMGGLDSFRLICQEELENNYSSYAMAGNSDRDIQIGFILKKNSPWKLREYKSHTKRELPGLSGTGIKSYFERDLAELHLINENDQHLICLGVHLKSQRETWGLDPKGGLKRTAEVLGIVERIEELRQKYPAAALFVMGDLNGNAGITADPEFLPLRDLKLAEVQERSAFPAEVRGTFTGYDGKSVQLDYLFFSPQLEPWLRVENSGPYTHWAPNSANPSDHLPVTAHFKS